MDADWAEENLNTIRTLMERASVYRLALAPVAMAVGLMGLVAAGGAQAWGRTGAEDFAAYWMAVAGAGLGLALLMMRRQAMKAGEAFWSRPTRQVAQALAPMFVVGLSLGVLELVSVAQDRDSIRLIGLWMVLYGGAIHAAGFFMKRGLKLLGTFFVTVGLAGIFAHKIANIVWLTEANAHWVMGTVFGGGHLLYGLYLKVTAEPVDEE